MAGKHLKSIWLRVLSIVRARRQYHVRREVLNGTRIRELDGLFEEGCEEMDANKRREPQDFH